LPGLDGDITYRFAVVQGNHTRVGLTFLGVSATGLVVNLLMLR
jgi:hypothetical protein